MKYTAKKLNNGDWAVFTGERFFLETQTKSEKEAKIKACELSAQWHQEQIDKIEKKWQEIGGFEKNYAFVDVLA